MNNTPDGQEALVPYPPLGGMTGLAEEMMRHHRDPMPGARYKPEAVFPRILFHRLAAGVCIGSILGLLLGILLYQGVITIPQAEELYSMGSVTFCCFWAFKGITVGMVCFGVWGIVAVPDETGNAKD